MIMGDNSAYPNLGGFDDHLVLEENNSISHVPFHIDQNPTNPACRDLGTIPYIETGISVLEETFSIDNGKQESNHDLATLLDASVDPYMFAEQDDNIFQNNSITEILESTNMYVEQLENIAMDNLSIEERSLEEGSSSKTIKEIRKSDMKYLATEKRSLSNDVGGGLSAILAKKQDHNAKEKLRRMKLHASYVALGSLLPKSRRSKKRRTAPVIIDKVLEYIPELEKEIQQLTMKKNSILSVTENRRLLVNKKSSTDSEVEAALTVSVNEIRKGGLILQICRKRDGANNVFSHFLQSIDEGICIVGASTIHVCEERECYHIHIQVNESSSAANEGDYIAVLKEKVISQLS